MVKGSCLCGAVAFEIDPAGIALSVGCYCVNCRKVSGGESGVYLQVRPGSFRWLAGQDQVAGYESSPGNRRGFCRVCGSITPIATNYGAVRVPGGALDEDPGVAPQIAIYTASKAPWCAAEAAPDAFEDAGPPELWRKMAARLLGAG
jgi:hypothetical protein